MSPQNEQPVIVREEVVPFSTIVNNRTLWLDEPVLGDIPGQTFLGRVVLEVWEKGELFFWQRLTDDNRVIPRAVSALLANKPEQTKKSPWTIEPALGNLEEQFLGRVVVEVWNRQSYISVLGNVEPDMLRDRALHTLTAHL